DRVDSLTAEEQPAAPGSSMDFLAEVDDALDEIDEIPDFEPEPVPEQAAISKIAEIEEEPAVDSKATVTAAEPNTIESADDELVDDFLNDLDPPKDLESAATPTAAAAVAPPDGDPKPSDPLESPMIAPNDDATTVEKEVESVMANVSDASLNLGGSKAEPEEPASRRPWVIAGVLGLAVILLGAGGYGVIAQRRDMQGEIDRLQAQLATTMTAEEAQEEREQQRQMEFENESLLAEITALEEENRALADQLTTLETQLAEQTADGERARVEAERIAAAQETVRTPPQRVEAPQEREPTPKAATSSTTTTEIPPVSGTWFVNFGSYAQRNVAERWANTLSVESGVVRVQGAEASGRTLYRVRVVGLANRTQAQQVAAALEKEYRLPKLWVGQN
ncbi:MAG: SPOR domain-containing protein, partial [Pseudomonadota bacterium]